MKKLLTIISKDLEEASEDDAPDGVEMLGTGTSSLYETLKKAKGKYTVLAEGDMMCDLDDRFFDDLSETNADIIVYDGGFVFKTSLLKGLNAEQFVLKSTAELFAALECKSVAKFGYKPFTFTPVKREYTVAEELSLSDVLTEFKKCKSKLSKEVYTFAFDAICSELCVFYILATLAVRDGKLTVQKLKEFDARLKENIVLYLAIDKRFTADNLSKLRERDFKISFITAAKFRKIVNA